MYEPQPEAKPVRQPRQSRRLPPPSPSRVHARAAAIVIPPRPITYDELLAALRSVSYMSRPRNVVQLERQLAAFLLWVDGLAIAEIARRLKVTRETVRDDLYHEQIHRRYGPQWPLPERRISRLDAAAIFRAWGFSSVAEVRVFVATLKAAANP